MLQEKINNLQKLLREQNIETLIVGNFGHQVSDDVLYYLILEKLECGMLVLPAQGRPTLYAISFEMEELRRRMPEVDVRSFDAHPAELLKAHMSSEKAVGIRPSALPASVHKKFCEALPSILWRELSGEEKIMAVKIEKEREYMRKAAHATDMIFTELIQQWHGFFTEMDAANFLLREMADRGLEPSFSPIVASGANASNPHHHPACNKIEHGFCIIDFGVRFNGYCSDMTRTICVGTPTKEEKDIYQTLLHAQKETTARVLPGVKTGALDLYCRATLGQALNKEFIHSLGHGLGSQVHEWPRVGQKEDVRLEEGMVITIEPGVYQKDAYGIRIEDDILVTKDGYETLTKSKKELLII